MRLDLYSVKVVKDNTKKDIFYLTLKLTYNNIVNNVFTLEQILEEGYGIKLDSKFDKTSNGIQIYVINFTATSVDALKSFLTKIRAVMLDVNDDDSYYTRLALDILTGKR